MTILQMIQDIEDAGKLEEFDRLVAAGRIMVALHGGKPHDEGYTQDEIERLGDLVMPEGWRPAVEVDESDLPF